MGFKLFSQQYWNKNDKTLIKGLAFLGEESEVFQRAPEDCKEAARALVSSGWKPSVTLSSDVLSRAVPYANDNFPY